MGDKIVRQWTFDYFLSKCVDEGNEFSDGSLSILRSLRGDLDKDKALNELKAKILVILEFVRKIENLRPQHFHLRSEDDDVEEDILELIEKSVELGDALFWLSDSGYKKNLASRCLVFALDLIIKCVWSLRSFETPENTANTKEHILWAKNALKEMETICTVTDQKVFKRCSKIVAKLKQEEVPPSHIKSCLPPIEMNDLILFLQRLVTELHLLLPVPYLQKLATVMTSPSNDTTLVADIELTALPSTSPRSVDDEDGEQTVLFPLASSSPLQESHRKETVGGKSDEDPPQASCSRVLPGNRMKRQKTKLTFVASSARAKSARPSPSSSPSTMPSVSSTTTSASPRHRKADERVSTMVVNDYEESGKENDDSISGLSRVIKKFKKSHVVHVNESLLNLQYTCKPPSHNTSKLGKWLDSEEDNLILETMRIGAGKWAEIKRATGSQRSTQQIKDKWRHLQKFPSRIQSVIAENGLRTSHILPE